MIYNLIYRQDLIYRSWLGSGCLLHRDSALPFGLGYQSQIFESDILIANGPRGVLIRDSEASMIGYNGYTSSVLLRTHSSKPLPCWIHSSLTSQVRLSHSTQAVFQA